MDPDTFEDVYRRLAERAAAGGSSPPKPTTPPPRPGTFASWVLTLARPHARLRPDKPRRANLVPKELREQIAAACRGEAPWPLTIHGLPGRGKSSAAMLLLDCVRDGVYMTGRECVDAEFGTGEQTANQFRYRWKRADLCVIDQFGMDCRPGSPCPPSKLQVFVDLIDYREGKPLVLVSNHTPAALGELFDAQVRDRIEGGTVIELCGPSLRANRAAGREGA